MVFFISCKDNCDQKAAALKDSVHSCMNVPSRFGSSYDLSHIKYCGDISLTGMIKIPGGIFEMGGDNDQASPDEYPKYKIEVSSFYMDINEVTNAQFKKFVDATGYITTAKKNLIGRN